MRNYQENLLLQLAPPPLRFKIADNSCSAPALEHCVGRGKLLGEFYGDALCESFKIQSPDIRQRLSRLSMLMRAFIVLDDNLKDQTSTSDDQDYIKKWLNNIVNAIQRIIQGLV